MQHRRVTRRGKTVIAIAGVAAGVLALLGVIEYALSGNNSAAQPNVTATTTTSNGVETPDGVLETTEPSAETKVATGSFKQQRGMLTIEVSRVEVANSRVKLFVTATNASQARMTLPVVGIAVVDDLNRTYAASSSKWDGLVTQGTTTSVLDEKLGSGVNSLTLTFGSVSGQFAPTGAAITVTGIPLPK
jgi:hypothetical protein